MAKRSSNLIPVSDELSDLLRDDNAIFRDDSRWSGFHVPVDDAVAGYESNEQRLGASLLFYALRTIIDDCAPNTSEISRENAIRWMQSNDEEWIFSYINACENCNIDPGYVRKRVTAITGIGFPMVSGAIKKPHNTKNRHAIGDDDLDWNCMYKLGSFLYMGGYRERLSVSSWRMPPKK